MFYMNKNVNDESSARLSHKDGMTSFCFGNQNIRFRTSDKLERYLSVKEWDNGYLVVMARYRGIGDVEEYIDLIPILQNLLIDSGQYLASIKNVRIDYEHTN